MTTVLSKLKCIQTKESTSRMYFKVWRQFNNFIVRLDRIPATWEDKLQLYCAYLIDAGGQSSTVKSYVSAIKSVLKIDGYILDDKKMLLNSLEQSCRLVNDRVRKRFPIRIGLLEMLLFELERLFSRQPYLEAMYKSVFVLAYYGLFRIGELTSSQHAIKDKDIHVAENKNKVLIMLYSSKMHGVESNTQQVKIMSPDSDGFNKRQLFFSPFKIVRRFFDIRGHYDKIGKIFFVFRDGSQLQAEQVRKSLRLTLNSINLDPNLYDTHSWRIGRASDLLKWGYSLAQIKIWGRWHINVVYWYIRESEL